jgi:hypothetical protein
MLGVTAFGLFLTPVFYKVVGRFVSRVSARGSLEPRPAVTATAEGH